MESVTEKKIQLTFSGDPERAVFPSFCNSIIMLEGPHGATLPVLTTRLGADGGIDGEWDLRAAEDFGPSALACRGWNVYQYKTVDVTSRGAASAFGDLCRTMRGAVANIVSRSDGNQVPDLYILFTNLAIGLKTTSSTANGRKLNTRREKLRASILEGAPNEVRVEIIDAGILAGIVSKYPFLHLTWFRGGFGISWDQMDLREKTISRVAVPLIGRDVELTFVKNILLSDATRVITISGTNGIGKTRLALEATRTIKAQTVFIENTTELLNVGVSTFASPHYTTVMILEDPPADVGYRLAEQALGSAHPVKLIITLPAATNAPVVRLADAERNKQCRLQPLERKQAIQLVEQVNPKLDNRARDWIIGQAAGIPGVLTDAAICGEKLWEEAGNIRDALTQKFRERVRKQTCSDTALNLLETLAPLAYVHIGSTSAELELLTSEFQVNASQIELRKMLKQLESLGYLRKRGDYVAVVPAMFAGGLLQDIIAADPQLPIRLYERTQPAARKRLFERLIPLDLPATNVFWDFMFGTNGPFGDAPAFYANIDLLEYLARAVPRLTADFLAKHWDFLGISTTFTSSEARRPVLGVLSELLEDSASAATAFELLGKLVETESSGEGANDAESAFSECFVYWYPRPLPYPVREAPVSRWLTGENERLQRIATRMVVTATKPPHSLGGRSVHTRSLGSQPVYGRWSDAHSFLERMVDCRLRLCLSDDEEVRSMARAGIAQVISELFFVLPLAAAVRTTKAIALKPFAGENPIELKEAVAWVRDGLKERGKGVTAKDTQAIVRKALATLDGILRRINNGSYAHRVRLAVGRTHDYAEREFEGRKLYEYHITILRLVREGCKGRRPFDAAVWKIFENGEDVVHAWEFFSALGECDLQHREFASILAKATDVRWAQYLAFYLSGAGLRNSEWVDDQIDTMLADANRFGMAILYGVCRRAPTEKSRSQLKLLLAKGAVAPKDVGQAFSSGRWLDQLPPNEVAEIFEFIASKPGYERVLTGVASLYLHPGKPLPRELFAVMSRALSAPCNTFGVDGYHYDQIALGIAQTDVKVGFTLLKSILEPSSKAPSALGRIGWNPFESNGSMRFWQFLRDKNPARAYKALGSAKNARFWTWGGMRRQATILNVAPHRKTLIQIARTGVDYARVFAMCLYLEQPEFQEFASELIELFPGDALLRRHLEELFIDDIGFGAFEAKLRTGKDHVDGALARGDISEAYRQFLVSLSRQMDARIKNAEDSAQSDEPFFHD